MVWKSGNNNRLANSLVSLIDEVDRRFPGRDKHNDGTIGDPRHQKKGSGSDHNPHVRHGSMGVVTALDITHDPENGFDAGAFAESLRESKDRRIKYVIFDGRIFNSSEHPWVWRQRNKGSGDHTEHVHVSVLADPGLFDDTAPWPFDGSRSTHDAVSVPFRPKLELGSTGPAVVDLQNLLGIEADGEFGPDTDRAVRAFQASRNLEVDGIVGSHTWGLLTESPPRSRREGPLAGLPLTAMAQIIKVAGDSELARVKWADRGIAPAGYVKGMAAAFGHVYAKWKAGDTAARLMAAKNSGVGSSDALAWYDARFRQANMDNSVAGADTLRHLFVLLIGLGMRESSGKYFEGRDMSARNVDADTAEAGLFQMSWNMRRASPEMAKLFAAYSADPDGFLSIFREGVPQPKPSDVENFGTGEGVAYQQLCKTCPAFAVETAAVGLRVNRRHWGPINRHEAEVRPEADRLLLQVQRIVDAHDAIVVIPPTEDRGPVVPPVKLPAPADNQMQPLLLVLALLLKGKTGAGMPGQRADLNRMILVLLLQSVLTGKQIDTTGLLNALLTVMSGKRPTVTPRATQAGQLAKLVEIISGGPGAKDGANLPLGTVNGALGATIGNLLNGKKTALGVGGALATTLLQQWPALSGPLSAALGLGGTAVAPVMLPIFLALTTWGVLGKMEKWTQTIVANE